MKKKKSTRQLVGIESMTDSSVLTAGGELTFYLVQPTNLNVLPESGVRTRVTALLNVLKTSAEMELLALDAKESYQDMRRLYAYLTTHRRIDRDVVTEFVREKLLYEDTLHHNCVFVGVDENGEARHAHLRSTNSQGKVFRINVEGSEAKHSFHKDGTDCSLYVFEAPIDLLSHITLYPAGWLEHSYVACCGTSVQPVLERLRQNPKLNMVYLCLDNDEAGEDACESMMEVLEEMDVDVERLRPQGKDWNDDLCAKRGGHG